MIKERLYLSLTKEESCNLKRHDVQGIDHIGWGINLESPWPDELLEYIGVEDEDDIDELTQEQADHILDHFVEIAINDAKTVYGDALENQTALRQEILINLSYNLGLDRLTAFRKLKKAVLANDPKEAAAQMLDSKAAREQAPERYKRLSQAYETNDEKHLELPKAFDETVEESVDRVVSNVDTSDLQIVEIRDMVKEIHDILKQLLESKKGKSFFS